MLFLLILGAIALVVFMFLQQPVFGKEPSRADNDRVYFQNVEPTEVMLKEASAGKLLKEFLRSNPDRVPKSALSTAKTDLHGLPHHATSVVWMGHSSYFIQINRFRILVDPVLSGHASPVKIFGKAFPGTDVYLVDEIPDVDLLILTHDHYDHLDYKTIRAFHPRAKRIVTAQGVGAHLRYWKIPGEKITELRWWQSASVTPEVSITASPARHFSGRKFTRAKTLWASFVLQVGSLILFIGGDSGYDQQFKEIGKRLGPFDLAFLEAGQYGKFWPLIHMAPEETVQAAIDLQARVLMPVHWGKFALANHAWYEPIDRVTTAASRAGIACATPRIGEVFTLGGPLPRETWWHLSDRKVS